ncbi:MAG: DUF1847 domain-containing protein [Proteobacteria bacterium]|nr:DUF1847 domain-containing protein [Pseudomonadota bacterium]
MPCASCDSQTCFTNEGEMPAGCPERTRDKHVVMESADGFLDYASTVREKETDRIDELVEYANFRGYKTIGIAGCIGLHDELRVISDRLKDEGFVVNTVMCKTGSLEKKTLGVPSRNRLTTETGYGVGVIACNPAAQALLLNRQKTDLNCILGLCVGHDAIFLKHSEAPVVTLIAKDRTNAHNSASILYGFYGDNFFTRRPSPEGASKFNSKHMKPVDIFRMIRKKRRS